MDKKSWIALAKKIDGVSEWTGKLFSWLVIPLTVLIVFEVFTRRFLNAPTIWTFETEQLPLRGPFHAGCSIRPAAQIPRVHRPICNKSFSKKTQVILSTSSAISFMFFPFIAVILYYGFVFATTPGDMLGNILEHLGPARSTPSRPSSRSRAVMLLLQGISEVIKTIDSLVRKRGRRYESGTAAIACSSFW